MVTLLSLFTEIFTRFGEYVGLWIKQTETLITLTRVAMTTNYLSTAHIIPKRQWFLKVYQVCGHVI